MKNDPVNKNAFHSLNKNCESTAQILKSLAHPQRLQLLCHLAHEEKTVGELEALCGGSQSAVSQFLGRMKREGLIASTKHGQFVKYRILDPRIIRTIQALQTIYCES